MGIWVFLCLRLGRRKRVREEMMMENCSNTIVKAEQARDSSHINASDPSKATRQSCVFSAPVNSTGCFPPSTLTVPSYTPASAGDHLHTLRTEGEILSSTNLRAFTFNELKVATRNFSPDSLIGEGGFGCVFKGWINEQTFSASKPGSGMVVAVKKLKLESFQGHKEWLTEVNYLSQLRHPNLVRLIGFCLDGDNRLLVYEFMPRGNLENHLFKRGAQPLSWAIRMKIAIEAARGLSYLHDSNTQVIYRDVKASNILLDSDFNSKLSDFGLAKAGPTGNMTHVSTRVIGTKGYAAPEYIATGHLSEKADVYSFGVVLLELLSGRQAYDKSKPSTEQSLVDWAKPFLGNKRKLFRIMDSRLEGQYPKKVAHCMTTLALQLIRSDAKLRPCMSEVLEVLELLQDPKGAEKHLQSECKKSPDYRKQSSTRHSASSGPHAPNGPPLRSTPGGSSLLSTPGGSPLWSSPGGSPLRGNPHGSSLPATPSGSPLPPPNRRSPQVHYV